MFFTPERKDYKYAPMYRVGPVISKAALLDELQKQIEAMYTATKEYADMTLELVDKKQVIKLIENMKEDL